MGTVKRAAVYCRVSTDSADQAHALESQRRYFQEYLDRSQEYTLWSVYADEGITGTSAQKRPAFMQMISHARQGLFDVVVTKEISRFARNTLDSIYYTRLLKTWNIGVIFVVDNINTLDPDAELRLTIMSSIAQEESRKISERVKWGQMRSMERGVVFGRDMLGYRVRKGKMEIDPKGADVVREIFLKYVEEGKGAYTIAKELEREGRLTARKNALWTPTAVIRILKNEKYMGNLVQKKTYTPNYLDHKKKPNQGEKVSIVAHHPAIVSEEIFWKAQRELERRSRAGGTRKSAKRSLSGKVYCAKCGSLCVARRKKDYLAWKCRAALGKKGCACAQIGEEVLLEAVRRAYESMSIDVGQAKEAVYSRLENGETKREASQKKLMAENLKSLFIMGYIEKGEFESRWKELGLAEQAAEESKGPGQMEAFLEKLLAGQERDGIFLGEIADRIETDGKKVTAIWLFGEKL